MPAVEEESSGTLYGTLVLYLFLPAAPVAAATAAFIHLPVSELVVE